MKLLVENLKKKNIFKTIAYFKKYTIFNMKKLFDIKFDPSNENHIFEVIKNETKSNNIKEIHIFDL